MTYKFAHFRLIIKNIVILLVFYTLTRLFFLAYNFESFDNSSFGDLTVAFLHGIRFDLSAIIYVNLFWILTYIPVIYNYKSIKYLKFTQWVFYISNFFAILFNIIDAEYFRFQKMRSSANLFSGENDILKLLPSYLRDYWWIIIMSLFIIYLVSRFHTKAQLSLKKEYKSFASLKTIALIMFFGVLIIAARGGMQTKPIQTITASYYGDAQNAALVLNTPFTIIQSIGKKNLETKNYFSNEELDTIFSIDKNYNSSSLFTPKNVVIIILESFSNEYIGKLNKGTSYSPFLDSLMNEGYLYSNAFANGKKSNEAMPSVIASIPSLMDEAYTGSIYQNNNINTLPTLLKSKGYSSAFFHGGFNGSMNFDAFAKKSGYDKYYGMNEYDNTSDYDGNWGIYDHKFMQYFAEILGSTPKPFLATFFSLSSHMPYSIPEEFKEKFKNVDNPKHRSYLYADYSLKMFFEYAKTKMWYTNTLFVILPDHTPDAENIYYDTKVSYYKIPILFYDPTFNFKGESKIVADQVDVMPTILDYLHYDKSFKAFGKSLLSEKNNNAMTVNYRDGIYQCIDSNYVLQYSNDQVLAFYKYSDDWYLKNNLKEKNITRMQEMLNYLKAYIQKFNVTLIDNNYKAQ
jgi:phosphoglycerol transferase MdoB-like AlkP superfamily enzyme